MEQVKNELRRVSVEELMRKAPYPPRQSDPPLDFLLSSVRIHGVLSPLLVRPAGDGLQIVCGHRRLLAARAVGLADVPVVVVEMGDAQAIRAFLAEKICRRQLASQEREDVLALLRDLRDRDDKSAPSSRLAREEVGDEHQVTARPPVTEVREGDGGESSAPPSIEDGPAAAPRAGHLVVANLLHRVRALFDGVREKRMVDFVVAEEVVAALESLALEGLPLSPDDVYGEGTDDWLASHSLLVASLNWCLAPSEGGVESCREYAMAGLLHDVGMVFVEKAYLAEPRALSAGERCEVQAHVRLGHALILGPGGTRVSLALAARDHHERHDGSGYPHGVGGDEVPRLTRATGLADTYASLVGSRPHRNALHPAAALKRLAKATEMGRYDPQLFAALSSIVRRRDTHDALERWGSSPSAPSAQRKTSASLEIY